MHKIAIFASGNGSNAENIINYFKENKNVNVSLIVSNKKDAFVLERAKKNNIPFVYIPASSFSQDHVLPDLMKKHTISFIILAGFLLKIPSSLIIIFPNKIINIHPALLPKYGGKGMYGSHVHEAVLENKEKESGISIHYVNENYDEGDIVFQAKCDIKTTDNPEILAKKIHALEYKHFPLIIEKLLNT